MPVGVLLPCSFAPPTHGIRLSSSRFRVPDMFVGEERVWPGQESARGICLASADNDFNEERERNSLPRFYKENWRLLALLLIAAPLVAYLLAGTVSWIYRGVRTA
jgi:hypothetical protein